MTVFGLKESDVAIHVRAVSGDDLTAPQLHERFARAAWSAITEPGDRVAGELIGAIGAVAALEALIARDTAETLIARLEPDAEAPPRTKDLESAIERWLPRLQSRAILRALVQAARFGAQLLIPEDSAWPQRFDDLGPHAPAALWVRGRIDTLHTAPASIALVGARAATGYGEHVTMEASAGLVDRGYTIVSGAAYGIDGMAHRAALASKGQTIAVLAGGVDRFYPSGHETLLTRIAETGAVISELPCGAAPTKWRFLQRNRLISAMSGATIVLEAGWRSGSLNTAGHAAALGRPLGAVPGPVTSAASAGCHRLIREFDAVCVTTAAEMAELAPLPGNDASATDESTAPPDSTSLPETDGQTMRVRDALSERSARTAADIAARSGLAIQTVQAVLGRLELDGAVAERENGWTRLALSARDSTTA